MYSQRRRAGEEDTCTEDIILTFLACIMRKAPPDERAFSNLDTREVCKEAGAKSTLKIGEKVGIYEHV